MDQVEGVWKNFTFKFIEKEDEARVLDHLRENFCKDEPIAKLVGEEEGVDSFEDYRQLYQWIFDRNEKLSFFAYDNDTKDIAGVRITFTQDKTTNFDQFTFHSHKIKVLFEVVNISDGLANAFERFGIDHLASFFTASTDRRYRQQGLLHEMYVRSLALLRERKYPLVKSIFTSPWSRKATTKLNFTHIVPVKLNELKDAQGHPLIPAATEEDIVTWGYILL